EIVLFEACYSQGCRIGGEAVRIGSPLYVRLLINPLEIKPPHHTLLWWSFVGRRRGKMERDGRVTCQVYIAGWEAVMLRESPGPGPVANADVRNLQRHVAQ